MKVYPSRIEEQIGFSSVKSLLVKFCQSHRGVALAQRIRPTDNAKSISVWLNQLQEFTVLKQDGNERISYEFPDVDEFLKRVEVPGSFLDAIDFHELRVGINTLTQWASFLKNATAYPHLARLSSKIDLDQSLLINIDRVIDERGEIKDAASPELLAIRQQISKAERAVRSAVQQALKKAKQRELTDDDSTPTIREGRLVIPLKAEHKRSIQGFIHDESATGQTVYLEPAEVLELNNEVKDLKYAERREVIRLLTMLSDLVRDNLPSLLEGANLMEKLDFIHAKWKLKQHLDATIPEKINEPSLELINARHPLLYLSHRASQKPVVPLTLTLTSENRMLIISGPNAGGKSIALKTVGLIQFMFQSGLAVPAYEESKMCVFSSIFLDIGDAQSIEDDLSTYSSHLTAIKYFLENTAKRSLILIDEFGKGTEPQFGGAIAESVLRRLNEKRAFGVITTHYQNLKKAGDEVSGLVNGAMRYDMDELKPLFELEIGKAGSSFAFEIASKIGIDGTILEQAKKTIGKSHVDYDQQLTQLEKEKARYEKMNVSVQKDQVELAKLRKDYESLKKLIDKERKQILKEAKSQAKGILEGANAKVEGAIREIKEKKAEKEATAKVRAELSASLKPYLDEKGDLKPRLKEGDAVSIAGQETVGVIQKVNGNQAEILFGGIKSIVNVNKLTKAKNVSEQVRHQQKVKKYGIDVGSKIATFSGELSLIGMRGEEALGKLQSYLDEALIVGTKEVRVVHGKGHGILRNLVRDYAKDLPGVEKIMDEHPDRGGAGISIITFG